MEGGHLLGVGSTARRPRPPSLVAVRTCPSPGCLTFAFLRQSLAGPSDRCSPDPAQRPTAKELLKHKFITRYTKKTSFLTELIDRYKRWKSEGHGEESSSEDSDM